MSDRGFLPSAHTQVDMAIIQGGLAHQVAYEHASKGCESGLATKHGTDVAGITLAWYLFALIPTIFATLCIPVVGSPIWSLWALGLDALVVCMKIVLDNWKHRYPLLPSPYRISGRALAGIWCAWGFAIFPLSILVALAR